MIWVAGNGANKVALPMPGLRWTRIEKRCRTDVNRPSGFLPRRKIILGQRCQHLAARPVSLSSGGRNLGSLRASPLMRLLSSVRRLSSIAGIARQERAEGGGCSRRRRRSRGRRLVRGRAIAARLYSHGGQFASMAAFVGVGNVVGIRSSL